MTDLDNCVLHLLKFIEDSFKEAINNPNAALETLSEADCTIRVLKNMLQRDQAQAGKFANLVLFPTFDNCWVDLAKDRPSELDAALKDALEDCQLAKTLFQSTVT